MFIILSYFIVEMRLIAAKLLLNSQHTLYEYSNALLLTCNLLFMEVHQCGFLT